MRIEIMRGSTIFLLLLYVFLYIYIKFFQGYNCKLFVLYLRSITSDTNEYSIFSTDPEVTPEV